MGRFGPPTSSRSRRARGPRPRDLRPGVPEHGGLPKRDHLHRRRQGHPLVSRLSHRAAGGALHLSRVGLPAAVRGAADRGAAAQLDHRHHAAHDAARERQEADGGVPVRRASDGDLHQHRRCAVHALSRRQAGVRSAGAQPAVPAAGREGREHRRLRVSPQHRPQLRLPGQRPHLHRQLPEHAVQDDRGEVPPQPGAGARARRAVHPARRPRAELQHDRDAGRSAARTWIRIRPSPARRPRCGGRSTAARTKPCCGCSKRSDR